MRQAGRYLPEYRQVRAKAGSFLNLCRNPELATEVTLQPLRRFNLDAAILFSDILVIPDALGLELYFVENEGPKFAKPLLTPADIDKLDETNLLEKLSYVFATVKNIQTELHGKIPLIGFSGSPFTLACYMLEGGSSSNYSTVKKWLYNNPVYMHKLLAKLTTAIIGYLNAQIEAGSDVVMLFDSWGGVLTDAAYQEFSLPYLQQIVNSIHKVYRNQIIPNIVFTKGGGLWLDRIQTTGANAIGLDWTIDIGKAKHLITNTAALQGNLDPVLLAVGDKTAIKAEVIRILDSYKRANQGSLTGHVFNLGHGILPMTNPDSVLYLVELVHELTRAS
jgi:uroporphyrinogen decarboxylase